MSKSIKQGLDYFPHDTDMSHDPKVEYIEAIHGLTGYAVISKLLEMIYRNGYYILWDNRNEVIFTKHNNINIDDLKLIINACISENIFDKDKFDAFKILTSHGIQLRYFEACQRRTKIDIIEDFMCLNDHELIVYKEKQNVNMLSTSCMHHAYIYPQSKVKESKGKESKKKVKKKKELSPKKQYLDFVYLTENEYEKLISRFGEKKAIELIENFNESLGMHGYKYNSHYHAILNWDRREKKNNPGETDDKWH